MTLEYYLDYNLVKVTNNDIREYYFVHSRICR